VNSLRKQANEEKQRAIKLESHSQRNNLNFSMYLSKRMNQQKNPKNPEEVHGGKPQNKQRRRKEGAKKARFSKMLRREAKTQNSSSTNCISMDK